MHRLLRCAGLFLLSLTVLLNSISAQSTGDVKKEEKKITKAGSGQEDKQTLKSKPDWSAEFAGVLTVLDEKNPGRLAFTVQVSLQYPELNTGTQQEIAQLQLQLAQQQIRFGQAKNAQALQAALFDIQQTKLRIELAKARLYKLKTSKLNVLCQAAENMRVRNDVLIQPIDPETGEYLKMTKEALEQARGVEGFPGYKADAKILQKGQAVRVFLAKDAVVPPALLDKDQKSKDKTKIGDFQADLKNTRYNVIMIFVASNPPMGGS